MVLLLSVHKKDRYAAFASWVEQELPKAINDPKVWDAFLEKSLMKDAEARQIISLGVTKPYIYPTKLGGVSAPGLFEAAHEDIIQVDFALTRDLSELIKAHGQADAFLAIQATVLHELVHWSYWHKKKEAEPMELGTAFEISAYGRPIYACRTPIHQLADADLGALSRKYEANKSAGAVGQDSTGGWSYGVYQIASKVGRMAEFLSFLHLHDPNLEKALLDAGGDVAARAGSVQFISTWKELADEPSFALAQHEFIKETHYLPFKKQLLGEGMDLDARSAVLRDVAWSTSVQHGPHATNIFLRASNSLLTTKRASDRDLIIAIYDERSKVDRYFSKSTPAVQLAVKQRFTSEKADALRILV
jgi:hypothetical protein